MTSDADTGTNNGTTTVDRLAEFAAEARGREERFSLAVRGANDGLWDWDIRTGAVYYSPRWKAMIGYADDEIGPRFEEWRRRIHPDDLERSLATIRDHLDGGDETFRLEHRLRHKDGSYRWILARGASLRDEHGVAYRLAGWHADTTARKTAEDEARVRARQQAAVAGLGQRALAGGDLQPLLDEATALVVETLDIEYCKLFELRPDGATLRVRAGYGGRDGEEIGETVDAGVDTQGGYTLATGEPVVVADLGTETRFAGAPQMRRRGVVSGISVVVHGHGDGSPDAPRGAWGVLGAHTTRRRDFAPDDVHFLQAIANVLAAAIERVRSEEQLRQQEAQYRSIFEAVSDGLLISDPVTDLIVEANPALCRMHGVSRDEVVGRSPIWLIHPDAHANRGEYLARVAAGGTERTRSLNVRRDGTPFPVEVLGTGFTFRGRPHIMSVLRDVTEQTRVQELLEHRLGALARIAENLTFDQSTDAALDGLAAEVTRATAAVAVGVGLFDEDTLAYRLAGTHGHPAGFKEAVEAAWRNGANLSSVQAAWARRAHVVRGIRATARADPGYAPLHDHLRAAEWDTLVSMPMIYRGRVVGTLTGYYRPDHEPGPDEVAFLGAIAAQAAMAAENIRLFTEAQDKATLEERQRLARDLHDSVAHALYDIGLGAQAAQTWLERDPARATEPLAYVQEMAEAGLAEMRALLVELRPETLVQDGLVAALEKRAKALRARHGLTVDCDLGVEPDHPQAVEEAIYRIAQEALHNVAKHARATRVALRLADRAGHLTLEVADDGTGFDPDGVYPGHLGLRSMHERVERLGGTLEIESAPDLGTRIVARVPTRGDGG